MLKKHQIWCRMPERTDSLHFRGLMGSAPLASYDARVQRVSRALLTGWNEALGRKQRLVCNSDLRTVFAVCRYVKDPPRPCEGQAQRTQQNVTWRPSTHMCNCVTDTATTLARTKTPRTVFISQVWRRTRWRCVLECCAHDDICQLAGTNEAAWSRFCKNGWARNHNFDGRAPK